MKYGWNVNYLKEFSSFGSLSRRFFSAQLLADEVLAENLNGVKRLLEVQRADPNTVVPEHGVAALHLMAGQEDEDFGVEAVLAALSVGGDPNVRSEEGLTPVHIAAMWGRCRILEVLLYGGGEPILVDYEMMLNAEEYALKERQWHAYGVLAAFSVLTVSEVRKTGSREEDPSTKVLGKEPSPGNKILDQERKNGCEILDGKPSSVVADDNFNWKSWKRQENPPESVLLVDDSSPENSILDSEGENGSENLQRNPSSVVADDNFNWKSWKRQETPPERVLIDDSSPENSILDNERKNGSENLQRNPSSVVVDDNFNWKSWKRQENPPERVLVDDSSPENSILDEESENDFGNCDPQSSSDVADDDFDWCKKTLEIVPLNENAIRIIKEQRKKTDVYEYPRWKLDSERSSLNLVDLKIPTMDKKDQEKPQEFSGMYFCMLDDDSFETKSSIVKNRCPSPSEGSKSTNNEFDPSKEPPKRGVLRKLSRIFLFALRKRNVYKRLK